MKTVIFLLLIAIVHSKNVMWKKDLFFDILKDIEEEINNDGIYDDLYNDVSNDETAQHLPIKHQTVFSLYNPPPQLYACTFTPGHQLDGKSYNIKAQSNRTACFHGCLHEKLNKKPGINSLRYRASNGECNCYESTTKINYAQPAYENCYIKMTPVKSN